MSKRTYDSLQEEIDAIWERTLVMFIFSTLEGLAILYLVIDKI